MIVKSAKEGVEPYIQPICYVFTYRNTILILIFSEINYDDNPVNSGRILLVDDQENWYELSNSTYYLTENTTSYMATL